MPNSKSDSVVTTIEQINPLIAPGCNDLTVKNVASVIRALRYLDLSEFTPGSDEKMGLYYILSGCASALEMTPSSSDAHSYEVSITPADLDANKGAGNHE